MAGTRVVGSEGRRGDEGDAKSETEREVVEGDSGVDATRKEIILLGFSRREDARSRRKREIKKKNKREREREQSDY